MQDQIAVRGDVPFAEAKRSFETAYVRILAGHARGNITLAAQLSGKDRRDFYYLLQRTGITPAEFRRFGRGEKPA